MRNASILRGIFSLALIFAVTALSCDNAASSGGTATTYTVTFAAGEGSGTPPQAVPAAENASITLPGKGNLTDPAAGRTFEGWSDGTAVYSAGDSYIVRGNATLTARWKAASTPGSFTVTFDADGGTGTTTKTVTPPATTVGTLPVDPTKTGGYSFGGWFTAKNGGGTQFTATSAVTADITVYAKWDQANPFVGGIWLDWDTTGKNYKFAEVDGAYLYYITTTSPSTFSLEGNYEYKTDELTLRPRQGDPKILSYEITKSLLIINKGKAGEAWYTKNPETGGGFNGEPGPVPIGGIWENQNDTTDCFGFNNDGECFISYERNKDGKWWWSVWATYEYKVPNNQGELTLRFNGIDGKPPESKIYKVVFKTSNQVMELTESNGKVTSFEKKTGN